MSETASEAKSRTVRPTRITTYVPVALIVCWLAIVVALAVRRMPYIDDGLYTLAPHSRMTSGHWGSPEIEPSRYIYPGRDWPLTRIDKRTYWIMPLTSF